MTYAQRIAKALREQVRPVMTILHSGDLYGAMATAGHLDPMPIYNVLKQLENNVFRDEAERSYRNIERLAGEDEKRNYVTDWLKVVYDYLTDKALNQLTTEITNTTYKNLTKMFGDAINEGWGQLEVAKRIEQTKEFEKITFKSIRQRSLTIARTEVNRARNAGHQAAGDKSKWVTEKVWSAANDMRTRGRIPNGHSNHWALNNVAVDQEELFTDPVSGAKLAYPGDISHGAGPQDVINCFLPDQLTSVNKSMIRKVYRSFYNGKVVTIKTATNRAFTCTLNHPILTTNGWVSAGLVNDKSNLIYSSFINDSVFPEFNVNDSPSTFEQIYNSFAGRFMGMRVSGSVMDFYGDGSDRDVNIIDTESLLRNRTKVMQGVHNKIFQYTNFAKAFLFHYSTLFKSAFPLFLSGIAHTIVRACNKFPASFHIGLGHSQIHAFAPVALGNAPAFQPIGNNLPAASKFTGKFFDAETGIIHGHDFVDGIDCTNVVSVIHSDYSGFVYTLETTKQIYDINGLVASNCRCRIVSVPKKGPDGRLIRKPSDPLGGSLI